MKGGGDKQAAHPVTTRCPAPQLRARLVRAAATAVEKTTLGPNNSPLATPGSPCQAVVGLLWAGEEANPCSPWVALAEIPWELWAPLVGPQGQVIPQINSEQPACDWKTEGGCYCSFAVVRMEMVGPLRLCRAGELARM